MINTVTIRALAFTSAACLLTATSSMAAASCAPRDKLVDRLTSGYGEALAGGGLQSATRVIEVWAAPETGTWTVVVTQANGLACIMASGTNWHQQEPALASKGIPG
jgi:hypothetical protein